MAECLFCGDFVGERNGDGGLKGRTIGNRDICEQCLGELKNVLEQVEKKTPVDRETSEINETEESGNEEREDLGEDPFSSKVKV